jgi:hypothetical protein
MNERTNGATAAEPPKPSGLGEAITQHADALVKLNTASNGMIQINPMQLFVDLELANVRIEVLFEALVETGVVDPQALTVRLRNKLLTEVEQMRGTPQIEIARGSVPRNG